MRNVSSSLTGRSCKRDPSGRRPMAGHADVKLSHRIKRIAVTRDNATHMAEYHDATPPLTGHDRAGHFSNNLASPGGLLRPQVADVRRRRFVAGGDSHEHEPTPSRLSAPPQLAGLRRIHGYIHSASNWHRHEDDR